MNTKTPLRVIVSLDVEEEGLFSGQYASSHCHVENVSLLPKLAPLTEELGFPLTLFCAYTVFAHAAARPVLALMRDKYDAEIGGHLHHWSTPPLTAAASPNAPPTRTDRLPRDILQQRLHTLLQAGQDFQSAPLTSFRMGRWDLKSVVRPLLAEAGIRVDSSVCPLRRFKDGPDHFLAPADPYWAEDSTGQRILESPVTQIPLATSAARLWYALTRHKPAMQDSFHFWGVLSPNPVWHGARVMRLATRLHRARGGQVLSLFWHSSEMLAGASPNIPDQAAADALLAKIYHFLRWLKEEYTVEGITASQLPDCGLSFPPRPQGEGDW